MIETSFDVNSANQLNEYLYETSINGLYYIKHKTFPDERGFYSELARTPELDIILEEPFTIKQVNQSRSKTNVIRGIHAEDWNKLITITNGACFCALVDLRKESPTFGKSETFLLGTTQEAEKASIFVSRGIGNSFCVIEGPADYVYAVDALYSERDKSKDVAVNLFDPEIGINWPIPKDELIFSKRDQESVLLSELK